MSMKKHKYFYLITIVIFIIFILSLLGIYKCPLKYITGIPCPTCGITRSITSLLSKNIKESFHYHALWPLIIISYILYILNEFNYLKLKKKTINKLIYIVSIIFIIYYLIRIFTGCPIVKINFTKSLIYKLYFK
jgi:hypothetical protein